MSIHSLKSWVITLFFGAFLVSCGDAPTGSGTTTITPSPTTPTSTPTQVFMTPDISSIKTDGSNSATLTITVLDAGSSVVENATVLVTTTGGALSASSVVTDATGRATVTLSAGPVRVNQTATVKATLANDSTNPYSYPIKIIGTTVTLSSTNTNVTATSVDTLTVTVRDAGGFALNNTPVVLTQTGAGSVALSQTTIATNANGTAQITVAGATAGSVTVTAAAAGDTATQLYTVTITGTSFAITSPVTDPYALSTNVPLRVTVTVPTGITDVTFATTLGSWNGGGSILSVAVTPVDPYSGTAEADLLSTQSGLASIQVFDTANISTTDTMTVAVSQPASQAAQVDLKSNIYVVAPSTGGVSNTTTLTATVRDAANQVVGGAVVAFSIPNSTGGGETLNPVVGVSDSQGIVTTTFTSGSLSTGAQGVDIYATVVVQAGNPAIAPAVANIVIGGTAGSVAIGAASVVINKSPTEYELPMSVLVADGNGNPVSNAVVTLKTFPVSFWTGHWVDSDPDPLAVKYFPCGTGLFQNEDINKDTYLDAGEDVVHVTFASSCDTYGAATGGAVTYPVNTLLDPPGSAAGVVPSTVTTDVNGVANFGLIYQKASAAWIVDQITASTPALGTETTASISFSLPWEKTEGEAGFLPNSTFGQ